MIIGSGYSAITALSFLLTLKQNAPQTKIVWMTRKDSNPYQRISNDPLPDRDQLAALGNQISSEKNGETGVTYLGSLQLVEKFELNEKNKIKLIAKDNKGSSINVPEVDQVLGLVGYVPDITIFRELHVHQCYASEGPMKLAASLLSASGDCLAQTSPGPDILKNPEPNFFILGSKSYGRNSSYLLKLGVEQTNQILSLL